MKSTRFSLLLLAALAITFSLTMRAHAQTFTTLANFAGFNGDAPYYGSLVQATNGNYYGTTWFDNGVVFQITPAGKLNDLYRFCSQINCTDGAEPLSSIVMGIDGNFYGTTNQGGSYRYGAIFKMTIGGKLTTLYSFCPAGGNCTDGAYPVGGLVQASNGNFYGTTANGGGPNDGGTIFEITPEGKFKLLHDFCSKNSCTDGSSPLSGLMQASNGNLYGTTYNNGTHSNGTVYEITTAGKFKTLYSFCAQTNCADGANPGAALIQGASGSLYGTTVYSGANGYGTVFEITTTNQMITLHSFDYYNDGGYPYSSVVQANDGNLYGTTGNGGAGLGGGTIYEVTSAGMFNTLYDFCSTSTCTGNFPAYTLAQATNGDLIGTTTHGGTGGYGTVYSFSTGLGPLVKTVPVAAKVGKRVIILGNGLTGSTSVTFTGTSAAFTVVSDTEITATVPTGAITGTVAVTTPSGTLNSNPVFQVLK